MRYAISSPPAGPPAELIACAVAAEQAGWDGFFLWDHIHGIPVHDPWVLLGAIGAATGRLRLGAMCTPLARRRPWKVAKEVITLDQLTGGRSIVGVGLGTPDSEFTAFGESADPRIRAEILDEALVVLDGLLPGPPPGPRRGRPSPTWNRAAPSPDAGAAWDRAGPSRHGTGPARAARVRPASGVCGAPCREWWPRRAHG